MKTLEEIYQIVEESSHETAFNFGEVDGLFRQLLTLRSKALIVEVGVQFGRSTTVLAEYQKERPFTKVIVIDNWVETPEAEKHFLSQIKKHNWNLEVLSMDSAEASKLIGDRKIDLLHIDGDHRYEGVLADCENFIPKVRKEGIVCFDDYGHPNLDGVKKAIGDYIEKTDSLLYKETFGNKLGVFIKR